MEFENDIRQLRWSAPSPALRARVLRDARAAARARAVPPWFAALERHWLYPGRVPATALIAAWLVILSLRFTTPVSLVPGSLTPVHLSEDDMVRIEFQRAQLFAELRRVDFDASAPPWREPFQQSEILPPRS